MTKANIDRNKFSDIDLIKGCIDGRLAFQEMLYKRYFSFAMSICVRYTKNKDEAMEVVNDGFMKMFDSLTDYNIDRSFKSWFSKILVNATIDSYRKGLKHGGNLSLELVNEAEDIEPNIDKVLSAEDILKLFGELPEAYRLTFNLYEIEGYSHEEIGEMLGIAESTSRSNLTRAKKMLRTLYNKHFNPDSISYEAV